MKLQGRVFIGTDLSAAADEALRQGAALARDLESTAIVCHILPELLRVAMLFPQSRSLDSGVGESIARKAEAAVRQQLQTVLGESAEGMPIVLDSGTPHTRLLACAEAADAGVIVIGAGRTVAGDIARHAHVPVLVARPSPRGPVLGATDLSEVSLPALNAAAFEAERRHSRLHLIYALDSAMFAVGKTPPAALPYLEGASAIALDGLDALRVAAEKRLRDALNRFAIEGESAVVEGHAAAAIVNAAQTAGAELVVVATHGRSGFARLTLGSTAAAVIDSAPCSVLVVRVTPG